MEASRIAAWSAAVTAEKAAPKAGVSLSTLGRYCSGETKPKGAALITITQAVEAWEKAQVSRE